MGSCSGSIRGSNASGRSDDQTGCERTRCFNETASLEVKPKAESECVNIYDVKHTHGEDAVGVVRGTLLLLGPDI